MFVIIGIFVVIGSVIGGYVGNGGELGVLFQPFEWIIIVGAAIGSMIIGNPKSVITGLGKAMGTMLKGPRFDKAAYVELLSLLYSVFKLAKTKGDLALESHVEKPDESPLFQKFPKFSADHHTREFLCDYLRLLTLGTNNAHEVELIIDAEIESHHGEGGLAGQRHHHHVGRHARPGYRRRRAGRDPYHGLDHRAAGSAGAPDRRRPVRHLHGHSAVLWLLRARSAASSTSHTRATANI